MKKNYTSFLTSCLIALAGYSALAQAPTITSAVLPVIGNGIVQARDTTPAELPTFTVTAGSSSAQTWNYSSHFVTTYTSGLAFISTTGGSGASNFPTANLAVTDGSGDWEYFTANASGLSLNGVYLATYSTAIPYAPGEMIIPTPFTYGNTNNSSYVSSYSLTTSGYNIITHDHSQRTITADAFGTLTTPAGTYNNTLRIKTYELDVDTQWIYLGTTLVQTTPSRDSSLTYEWLQNSHPVTLMEIDMNGTGTSVTGANYTSSSFSGIETRYNPFTNLSLYPNPATVAANLTYENKCATHVTIDMFDISGRFIANLANENQSAGKQTLAIDTKALQLNGGLYFVRISGANGSETIKLSVN